MPTATLSSPPELLTVQEVADLLRVPVPTIRWLRQEKKFAPAMKVGRRLVWDRAVVLAWLQEQAENVS